MRIGKIEPLTTSVSLYIHTHNPNEVLLLMFLVGASLIRFQGGYVALFITEQSLAIGQEIVWIVHDLFTIRNLIFEEVDNRI